MSESKILQFLHCDALEPKSLSHTSFFPDPQFEGLDLDSWSKMLEKVELHDPSQLEIASVISGRFNQQNKELGVSGVLPTLDDNSLSVDFDSSSVAGKSNKIYPRTPSEQADYDRQGLDYDAAKKLLDFGGLKILENPRYLPKRFVSTLYTQCGN